MYPMMVLPSFNQLLDACEGERFYMMPLCIMMNERGSLQVILSF